MLTTNFEYQNLWGLHPTKTIWTYPWIPGTTLNQFGRRYWWSLYFPRPRPLNLTTFAQYNKAHVTVIIETFKLHDMLVPKWSFEGASQSSTLYKTLNLNFMLYSNSKVWLPSTIPYSEWVGVWDNPGSFQDLLNFMLIRYRNLLRLDSFVRLMTPANGVSSRLVDAWVDGTVMLLFGSKFNRSWTKCWCWC